MTQGTTHDTLAARLAAAADALDGTGTEPLLREAAEAVRRLDLARPLVRRLLDWADSIDGTFIDHEDMPDGWGATCSGLRAVLDLRST